MAKMQRKRWLGLAYGIAVVASYCFRAAHPHSVALGEKQLGDAGVKIAYYDSAPTSGKPVVLLIHGSPGSSDVVRGLARMLPADFRVIAPDLPGFGASEHRLEDYSFRAQAQYIVQLMNALHIGKVHAAGFSMGGGVVLSLAGLAPERVCSIEMISAIGVQEQELTGNYWLNHALHGLLLAALWALQNGTPHFGALGGEGVNVEFARNFFDSDQRPLRQILQDYRGPMLIVHGSRDRNVPLAAAMEHHRLAPQSELIVLDSNHFMIFQRPGLVAGPLNQFLGDLRSSCAP
jgi:pimeloyl-ACP methyl ester carboxylesterase